MPLPSHRRQLEPTTHPNLHQPTPLQPTPPRLTRSTTPSRPRPPPSPHQTNRIRVHLRSASRPPRQYLPPCRSHLRSRTRQRKTSRHQTLRKRYPNPHLRNVRRRRTRTPRHTQKLTNTRRTPHALGDPIPRPLRSRTQYQTLRRNRNAPPRLLHHRGPIRHQSLGANHAQQTHSRTANVRTHIMQ